MWRQVCAAALLTTVLCASGNLNRDDRQTRSSDTFWISGRYGRSQRGPAEFAVRNNRVVRHAVEDPEQQKSNRFFLTNRYGKRSGQLSERLANRLTVRFGDRWKRQIVCDCVPREHYKRSAFGLSA